MGQGPDRGTTGDYGIRSAMTLLTCYDARWHHRPRGSFARKRECYAPFTLRAPGHRHDPAWHTHHRCARPRRRPTTSGCDTRCHRRLRSRARRAMNPSTELRDLTIEIAQAISDGDMAVLERYTSRHPGTAF